jgi:APA family basic amino acid/polyamine antiporter
MLSAKFISLIVSCIYITLIYVLSSSTLQEIATAESDRVAVVASQYIWFSRNFTDRGDHYDIDLACNNGLIMAGARCIIQWRKMVSRKAAAK